MQTEPTITVTISMTPERRLLRYTGRLMRTVNVSRRVQLGYIATDQGDPAVVNLLGANVRVHYDQAR